MTVALSPMIPDLPVGARPHPVLRNVCAFADGTVMTYDPRLKGPQWYACKGQLNTHGRRQSQIAKKMRLHYQIVHECFSGEVPRYHTRHGGGLTIDHIDGDRDNNAAANLRLVSLRENVRAAACKSGMPYAIRKRENGTFRTVLRVSGVMRHLGTFKTEHDALVARDNFLMEHAHGA